MSIEIVETEPGLVLTDYQKLSTEKKRNNLQETLLRHSDLLGEVLIRMIVDREYSLSLREALTARKEGLVNDDQSTGAGITAFLTRGSVPSVERVCKDLGYDLGDEHLTVGEEFATLRFKEGLYRYGGGGIRFYPKTENPADPWSGHKNNPSFRIGTEFVVRVQGDSGELWQNTNYTWEGAPKESKPQSGGWYVIGPSPDTH